MQNIIIDKKTGFVTNISRWEDGTKLDNPPDTSSMLVYDENDTLDIYKSYKYTDGSFIEVELDNGEASPDEILTQQMAKLAIENKKKDIAIQSLVKTVADLNIELHGGTN